MSPSTLIRTLTAFLMLGVSIDVGAIIVLTYTGPSFTQVADSTPPAGTYTTDMRVTGTITLAETHLVHHQGYSTWNGPGPVPDHLIDIDPVAFSFSDGRFTYASTDSGVSTFMSFNGSATGVPESWTIVVNKLNPTPDTPTGQIMTQVCGNFVSYSCDQGYIGPAGGTPFDAAGIAVTDNVAAGTWTVSQVPELDSYLLFLTGVAVVALVVRQRRK